MTERESLLEKVLKDSADDFPEFSKKIEKYLSDNLTDEEKESDNYIYYIAKIGYKLSALNITLNQEALSLGWKNIILDKNNLYVIKIQRFIVPKDLGLPKKKKKRSKKK